jgi:hypothetical protein
MSRGTYTGMAAPTLFYTEDEMGGQFKKSYPWAVHPESVGNAYEPVVNTLYRNHKMYYHATLRMTASAILNLLTQVGVLLLTLWTASCKEGGSAVYSFWIWLLVLPAFAFKAHTEFYALQFVTLPFALRSPWRVLTRDFGFVPWLVFYGVVSQLALSDNSTDSMFTGITVVSSSCAGDDMRILWELEWSKSLPGQIGIPAPAIQNLALGFWLFSLLQMIMPVIRTLGVSDTDGSNEFKTWLHCFCGVDGYVGKCEAFFARAEAAGMSTIGVISIKASEDDIRYYASKASVDDYKLALINAARFQGELVDRMLYSYIGENCVQLNIQSTLYVLQVAAARARGTIDIKVQIQALASLTVGMLMTLLKLAEVKDVLTAARAAYNVPEPWLLDVRDRLAQRRIRRQWWLIILGCIALVGSLAYSVAKISMAHVCITGLWNITGCVDWESF